MLHSSSQLNSVGKIVSLFRETVLAQFFSLVSLKLLSLVAWMLVFCCLRPRTKCTLTSCLVLRPYLMKKCGCCFFLSVLEPCCCVSCWKAGVCLCSLFQGFFEGLFFWSSLCVANTHLLCACLPLPCENVNFISFLVRVSWSISIGRYRRRLC